jgi:hypothetical protein
MSKKAYHVIAKTDSGWSVRKTGAGRAVKHFENKEEAVEYGKELSRSQGTELFVHGRNGRIQEKNSYGRDPYPPCSPSPNVWVSPHPDGWAVKREHSVRVSRVFPTKAEAEQYGRGLAQNEGVQLVVQRKDGTIQEHLTYAAD